MLTTGASGAQIFGPVAACHVDASELEHVLPQAEVDNPSTR
jgi:hypothetical protein